MHAVIARPRHRSCQTLITLTRRPLRVSRALNVLGSCVLCLAPPAVDLLEPGSSWSVYVYETGLPHVCVYIALLLLPLSLSSGLARRRFPSLASCPKLFDVAHCHSHGSLLLRRLACTRWACRLFAHVALLLLPLSLFLGVRAPSLSLGRFMNYKLLDVAH